MHEITQEKLDQYFSITQEALAMAENAPVHDEKGCEEVLDMVRRYVSDAKHFASQGNRVLAFAALNYAHGWLDAGARLGVFEVHDSRLFTVD